MKNLSNTLESDICVRLLHVSRIIAREYNRALATYNITHTQLTALIVINLYPKIAITTLSHELGMERSTLSRLVDGMRRKGFLQKEVAKDERIKIFKLTEAGLEKIETCIPIMESLNEELLNKLDPKFNADKLFKALERLTD